MRIVKFSLLALLLATLFSSLSYGVTPDRISGLISSSQAIPLAKSLHPRVQAEFDRGVVEPSFKLSYVTLTTKPSAEQQRDLNQLLAAQQNPKSPLYHKWLTPAQYADRFGLSQNDINRITDWLKAQGFLVLSVGGGRNSVVFSGTAAQVQSAFKTEIHRYNVDGEEHIANATPVMIPGALNGVVTGIRGLHDFRMQAANRTRSPRLQSNFFSPNFVDLNFLFPNFLAPADVATIYDINPLYNATPTAIDGSGQKIAIVGQTDIFLADINDFRSGFGLTPISGCTLTTTGITGIITACNASNFQYVLVGTDASPAPGADIGEADLDVEWSGAVAPNAKIVFVNAPNTANGVGDSLAAAINPPAGPPLAQIISMSYGICEAFSGNQETELTQANAEGVTVLISSGDAGAATCDRNPPGGASAVPPFSPAVFGAAVSYPASSPEVTAVGGTAISTANDSNPPPAQYWSSTNGTNGGTALQYIPETPWNDNSAFGQFCAANATVSFCHPTGGVVITNAATFQQDYWIFIAGGGASNCFSESNTGVCQAGFPQPTWQQGLTVAGAPAAVRWVPDVSLFGSPNLPGYIFCTPINPGAANYTSTCGVSILDAVDTYGSTVGGTSVSTPVFAGMVALFNQYLGGSSTSGLGNINPKLYELAATASNNAFHRVTTGDNKVTCAPGQPSNQTVVTSIKCPSSGTPVVGFSASNADATTGYNLVTGLGSVDANNLAVAWLASEVSFSTGATTLTPASVAAGHSATSTVTITPLNTIGTTATYSFSCSGLPAGASCSFSPTTVVGANATTLTVSTLASAAASGPTTVTVTGSSGGVTASTTVSLTITATDQSFTLAPGAATYAVTQGGSVNNATVTLTGTNGFNTPVTYTCTDPAPESRCTATATATGANFVITTTAPTAAANQSGHSTRIFYAALLPGLLGIMFTAGSRKRSLRGMRMLGLIVVLGFSTMWLGSCGGSGGGGGTKDPGTPKGSYTITVNATTGGANPVTATTTFTLQVN